MSSTETTSSSSSASPCWICHVADRRLTTGFCACIGSLGRVHANCLQKFINSRDAVTCPTCSVPYDFLYVPKKKSTRSSGDFFYSPFEVIGSLRRRLEQMQQPHHQQQQQLTPPIASLTSLDTWRFLFHYFHVPFTWSLICSVAELCMHWLLAPTLIGSVLLSLRGYHNPVVFASSNITHAWLAGFGLLLMKRRMAVGAIEIHAACSPKVTVAATTAAATALPRRRRTKSATTAAAPLPSASASAAAATALETATPGNANGDDDEKEEEKQDEHRNSSDHGDEENDEEQSEEEEEEEEEEEDNDDYDGEGDDDAVVVGPARTPDTLLIGGLHWLQGSVRSPRTSCATDAMNMLLFDDIPTVLLHALVLGAAPLIYFSVWCAMLFVNSVRYPTPKLQSSRDRYEEAGRRLSESTEGDRARYCFIYKMDVVLLYFALPYLVGVVSHEALGSHLVFPSSSSSSSVVDATAAAFNNNNKNNNSNIAGNALFSDFVQMNFHPLRLVEEGGAVARVVNRVMAQTLDHPWVTFLSLLFGYAIASLISSIEARIVSVMFAPGVRLIVFRSFHPNSHEEVHTFSFMLRQLFDLNAFQASTHCFYLFSSFLPMCYVVLSLLVNTVRAGVACGGALVNVFSFMILVPSGSALLDDLRQRLQQHIVDSVDIVGFLTSTFNDPKLHAAIAKMTGVFAETWLVVYNFTLQPTVVDKFSLRFLGAILAIIIAGGALYLLPHQYMILERIKFSRTLAQLLGLHDFLFEEDALQRLDEFLVLSRTLDKTADTLVDLQPQGASLAQIAVRRERWLEPARVPRFLQVRVAIFTLTTMSSLLYAWIVEVVLSIPAQCLAALYVGLVCFDRYNNFATTVSPEQQQQQHLLGNSTSSSGAIMMMAPITRTLHKQFVCEHPPWFQFLPLTSLDLLALALILSLRRHPTALAMSLGYVMVIPFALLFGLAEFLNPLVAAFKSGQAALQEMVDSVFVRAFSLKRLVVPKAKQQPRKIAQFLIPAPPWNAATWRTIRQQLGLPEGEEMPEETFLEATSSAANEQQNNDDDDDNDDVFEPTTVAGMQHVD